MKTVTNWTEAKAEVARLCADIRAAYVQLGLPADELTDPEPRDLMNLKVAWLVIDGLNQELAAAKDRLSARHDPKARATTAADIVRQKAGTTPLPAPPPAPPPPPPPPAAPLTLTERCRQARKTPKATPDPERFTGTSRKCAEAKRKTT